MQKIFTKFNYIMKILRKQKNKCNNKESNNANKKEKVNGNEVDIIISDNNNKEDKNNKQDNNNSPDNNNNAIQYQII